MIRIIYFSLLVGVCSQLYANQDKAWNEANNLYGNERYQEAIQAYLKVDSMGYVSSGLYYNLGNAYFKTGKLGKAILYYSLSLKLDANNQDAQHNLTLVEQQLKDKFKPAVKPFVDVVLENITSITTPYGWSVISIVFALLFLLTMVLTRLGVLGARLATPIVALWLVLNLFSLYLNHKKIEYSNTLYGIITQDEAWVLSAPNGKTKLYKIHDGTRCQIIETFNEWVEIRLPDNNKGWIKLSEIEPIQLSDINANPIN